MSMFPLRLEDATGSRSADIIRGRGISSMNMVEDRERSISFLKSGKKVFRRITIRLLLHNWSKIP